MNTPLFSLISILLYVAAAAVFAARLFGGNRQKPARALGMNLGFAALGFHLTVLYQALHTEAGVNFGFFNSVSFAAWVMALVLMLSSLRKPLENLGILMLPMTALTLLLALLFPSVHILPPDTHWELRAHVLTSLLAYSVLAMASVQALLLYVQDRALRGHHPGGFVRALPPLQTMEALMFEMILVGFMLLSVALVTGFLFLEDMFAQHLVHKTLLSILAWLVFLVLIFGRYRFGWRGRIAIRWTLTGFIILALAYFGSKAVVELILQRTSPHGF